MPYLQATGGLLAPGRSPTPCGPLDWSSSVPSQLRASRAVFAALSGALRFFEPDGRGEAFPGAVRRGRGTRL